MYTKESGLRSLYRGFVPTILGVIPYAGTSFFTYETLKQKYFGKSFETAPHPKFMSALLSELTGETKTNALSSLLFGACAGICGQTSSYPLGETTFDRKLNVKLSRRLMSSPFIKPNINLRHKIILNDAHLFDGSKFVVQMLASHCCNLMCSVNEFYLTQIYFALFIQISFGGECKHQAWATAIDTRR